MIQTYMFGYKGIVIKLARFSLTWTLDLYKLQKCKFRIMDQSGCYLQYQCSFFLFFIFLNWWNIVANNIWQNGVFLISAKVNHMKHTLKIHCFQYNNYCSISFSGNVMTFHTKKVKICGLKPAFIFTHKKTKNCSYLYFKKQKKRRKST